MSMHSAEKSAAKSPASRPPRISRKYLLRAPEEPEPVRREVGKGSDHFLVTIPGIPAESASQASLGLGDGLVRPARHPLHRRPPSLCAPSVNLLTRRGAVEGPRDPLLLVPAERRA